MLSGRARRHCAGRASPRQPCSSPRLWTRQLGAAHPGREDPAWSVGGCARAGLARDCGCRRRGTPDCGRAHRTIWQPARVQGCLPLVLCGPAVAAACTRHGLAARIVHSAPREERDLFVAASNSHVLAFDNVSGLPGWLSDALCRLSTGGGWACRQLYTDNDEVLFDGTRPAVLNGIEHFISPRSGRRNKRPECCALVIHAAELATKRP
jgi:hypothetical protein